MLELSAEAVFQKFCIFLCYHGCQEITQYDPVSSSCARQGSGID